MISDHLVVGIQGISLSECRQIDAYLTLEKARQRKAVQELKELLSDIDKQPMVVFKLDTGAEVTAITEPTLTKLEYL